MVFDDDKIKIGYVGTFSVTPRENGNEIVLSVFNEKPENASFDKDSIAEMLGDEYQNADSKMILLKRIKYIEEE